MRRLTGKLAVPVVMASSFFGLASQVWVPFMTRHFGVPGYFGYTRPLYVVEAELAEMQGKPLSPEARAVERAALEKKRAELVKAYEKSFGIPWKRPEDPAAHLRQSDAAIERSLRKEKIVSGFSSAVLGFIFGGMIGRKLAHQRREERRMRRYSRRDEARKKRQE